MIHIIGDRKCHGDNIFLYYFDYAVNLNPGSEVT